MLLFFNNASATVTSGGTTAITGAESWTVNSVVGFPTSLRSGDWFHVADPVLAAEKIKVTAISGSGPSYTWTVTRADEGSTAAHSANFVIQQVVTARDFGDFTLTYNVMAYGAKGDGTTDDTSAINAAVTAAIAAGGGKVYFPYGTYLVSAPVTVTSDAVVLEGEVRGDNDTVIVGAQLKVKSGFTGTAVVKVGQSGTPTRPLTGITIRGLTVNGNAKTGSNIDGIFFQAYNSMVFNCRVFDCSGNGVNVDGITGWTTYNTKVSHCWISGSGLDGLHWGVNSTDTDEINCHSFDNAHDGSNVNGAAHLMQGCHHYGNTLCGIRLNGVAGARVIGCEPEGNGQHGICLDDSSGSGPWDTMISGCHLHDNSQTTTNTYDEIIVASTGAHGSQALITGCTFLPSSTPKSRYGVNLVNGQAQNCLVYGNYFDGSYGTAAVHAAGNATAGSQCAIRGNMGVNPAGAQTPPAVPATGVALTNPFNYDCMVYVKGGASTTAIAVGGTATGSAPASGVVVSVLVEAGQSITLTYTSTAPSWTWFAL